jgi:uncharacterized protein DUF6962
MTVLTDYGLAAAGGALGVGLWRSSDRQVSRRLWAASFMAIAGAAVAGGTWHGFAPRMDAVAATSLWRLTYGLVGLGNFLILAGAAVAAARAPWRDWLLGAAALRFAVSFAFLVLHPDFRYVVYDYAGTLVGLLVLAAWLARRGRPGAPAIVAGVVVSVAGAAVQRSGLTPSAAFNHNDLFHVIQAAGLYLYYRAGRRLRDRG